MMRRLILAAVVLSGPAYADHSAGGPVVAVDVWSVGDNAAYARDDAGLLWYCFRTNCKPALAETGPTRGPQIRAKVVAPGNLSAYVTDQDDVLWLCASSSCGPTVVQEGP